MEARLENATKVYGTTVRTTALLPTTLELEGGELTIILGPSGSGKTTLLNLLGGLDAPSGGKIVVGGVEVSALDGSGLVRYRRDAVGFVFQFFNLLPSLTAVENVLVAGELAGVDEDGARGFLASVGIADLADRFPSEMSGGQQQRVGIARALAKKPKVLLADEPTGALDHESGAQVFRLLKEAAADPERIVVAVTHDEGALEYGDRVIRVRDGAVVEDKRLANGATGAKGAKGRAS